MNDHPFHAAVFGATSVIATEILRVMAAERRCELLLVGRDPAKLEVVAGDLRARGATCEIMVADLTDLEIDWATRLDGRIWDLFLIAHGSHVDQQAAMDDPRELARAVAENFTSQAVISSICTRILERQKRGTLAVLGAACGDQTDASDFVHASAKAGLAAFVEGLADRFAPNRKLHAVLLKPGPTDTPETASHDPEAHATPVEQVGQSAWEAIRKGRKVTYIPAWYRPLMTALRVLPGSVSRRTRP